MRKLSTLFATVVATAALSATAANASLLVSATVGGGPAGQHNVNFDNLTPGSNASAASGGTQVSFTGDAKAVTGAQINVYAAPYLSNNNGSMFGDPNNGPDTTPYLSTGLGSVTVAFASPEHYVGLLWGSVDTYNTLYLYDGATLVGTVTGSDVTAGANGDRGINGTFYVNIISTLAFDSIVAKSSAYAFEFDNLSYGGSGDIVTPEPLSLSLFGAGLALFAVRRKRRS